MHRQGRISLGSAIVGALLVLLTGCSSDDPDPESSAPPSEYIVAAESDDLNAMLAGFDAAYVKAADQAEVDKCNATETVNDQAQCLNELLQPLSDSLGQVSAAFAEVASRGGLRAECVSELNIAAQSLLQDQASIDQLIADFASTDETTLNAAAGRYFETVDPLRASVNGYVESVSPVCYSPEDLEEANNRESASPAP